MNEEYRLFLYPFEISQIASLAESYADELDYKDSFMYDEYPDKVYLDLILDKLHRRILHLLSPKNSEEYNQMCRVADCAFVNQIYIKRSYML